jgi:hypothetical protein
MGSPVERSETVEMGRREDGEMVVVGRELGGTLVMSEFLEIEDLVADGGCAVRNAVVGRGGDAERDVGQEELRREPDWQPRCQGHGAHRVVGPVFDLLVPAHVPEQSGETGSLYNYCLVLMQTANLGSLHYCRVLLLVCVCALLLRRDS